jgi:hypothetical protein
MGLGVSIACFSIQRVWSVWCPINPLTHGFKSQMTDAESEITINPLTVLEMLGAKTGRGNGVQGGGHEDCLSYSCS